MYGRPTASKGTQLRSALNIPWNHVSLQTNCYVGGLYRFYIMCLFGLYLTLYSSNFLRTQVLNKFAEHMLQN